jgi:uncharacterized membrane protein
MIWFVQFRIRSFLQNSVWFTPLIGMIAAILIHRMVRAIDLSMDWYATAGIEGTRALLTTLAGSMFTFIVFVFSILLLSVQVASAQLTPRIIVFFYRNPVLKFSLTFFVFTFTFTLAVLFRIGEQVLQMSLYIAVFSCITCIAIFLYMIDHVGKSLRPISLMNLVGNQGQKVLIDVYPNTPGKTEDSENLSSPLETQLSLRTVETRHTGVILAFDIVGVAELARRNNCLIEFIPQVGDFVTFGDPLFRLYQGGENMSDRQLQQKVAIGQERTLQQDPGFAFRIIADIAAKALSPAINDPTTAVLALDQIHRLLRVVARRQLNTGQVFDKTGQLRLVYRTPNWNNFISLALTEIRYYGKGSIQVVRRMRALLDNLIEIVPPQRAAALRVELEILNRGVEHDFYHPEDRANASVADSLGVGGSR